MYTTKKLNEIDFKKYKNYKLCLIESIPETIYDYLPGVKEKYADILGLPWEEYQKVREQFDKQEQPNPDYKKGEFEYWAYFTPLKLDEQWGDDWGDSYYDGCESAPYDKIVTEVEERNGLKIAKNVKEVEILKVPFHTYSYHTKFPYDYAHHGQFSIEDINRGVVAWLYDSTFDNKYVIIHAGCSPRNFKKFLGEIKKNNQL
jgi:hypothetical protein